MTKLRLILLVLFLPVAACQPATEPAAEAAADPQPVEGLELFYGYWEGATAAEADTPRFAALLIEPSEGGFNIAWQNLGTADAGVEVRESELAFVPSQEDDVWLATNLPPGVSASSRLDANTLTTTIEGPTEAGPAVQIYERTVTGDRLILDYAFYLDGVLTREIEATYQRVLQDEPSS
jgi:hypothetical protein